MGKRWWGLAYVTRDDTKILDIEESRDQDHSQKGEGQFPLTIFIPSDAVHTIFS